MVEKNSLSDPVEANGFIPLMGIREHPTASWPSSGFAEKKRREKALWLGAGSPFHH